MLNHVFDPASVFLSTHWWSQHPDWQRCFYKLLTNCKFNQQVSAPPVETLTLWCTTSFPGAAARHSQPARVHTESPPTNIFPSIFSLNRLWLNSKVEIWVLPDQPDFLKKNRVKPAQLEFLRNLSNRANSTRFFEGKPWLSPLNSNYRKNHPVVNH